MQQQRDLQEEAKIFEKEFKKILQATQFPDFPTGVLASACDAMRHESLATLGCGMDTFRDLLAGKTDLYTVSFLLNALQARTPFELGYVRVGELEMYADFQDIVGEVVAKWNGLVQPIKEKLANRIQAHQKLSQGVPTGKIVPLPSA